MTQAELKLRKGNPDVLTSIANLSNDEVFTPPEFANKMLDTLEEAWAASNGGASIWEDSTVTFLDPFTKSGVFLREITERLTHGLEKQIPNLQERVNHILTKQVYGIGITQLTALLARRSVYCSKWANGEHSIATAFDNPDGNIWFERTEHTWVGGKDKIIVVDENGEEVTTTTDGKCKYCGAPKKIFGRGSSSESYAYFLTHSGDIQSSLNQIFGTDMKFDVVIGNPPYQMAGGAGGSSDSSIYQHFVVQAQQIEPRFLSMVIPSRWLVGGRGLDEFRSKMLGEHHIVELVDFPVSKEVFPGVEVKGGVCYFLWDKSHQDKTKYTQIRGEGTKSTQLRFLDEFDVFIRDEVAITILRKVLKAGEQSVRSILTNREPFRFESNFSGYSIEPLSTGVKIYFTQKGKRSFGYVRRDQIDKNEQLIDKWKVLVPKAGSDGGQKIPDSVLGKPWSVGPNSVCTGSFLAFCFDSETDAKNFEGYYKTRFFRFLVSLRKITQDAFSPMYQWVPMQTWSQEWSDEKLFQKYGLDATEIEHINNVIRSMESDDDKD